MKTVERVKLTTAKLAKEAGFDWPTNGSYTLYTIERIHPEDGTSGPFGWEKGEVEFHSSHFINFEDFCDFSNKNYTMYAAPSQSHLQKWLRMIKGIILYVEPYKISSSGGWSYCLQQWNSGKLLVHKEQQASSTSLSFEEALEEGLQESLKLLIDEG